MVLLVRHGQASFGADDYDVLSETGVAQSQRLGAWLAEAGVEPDAVLHGAMRRQRDTATAMVEGAGWSVVPRSSTRAGTSSTTSASSRAGSTRSTRTLAGLDHRMDRRAFQRAFEEATARWSGGEHDDEYDESWPAFVGRATAALDRACARDGVTVVVSSGGPIAVACAALVDPDAAARRELPRLWNAVQHRQHATPAVTRVIDRLHRPPDADLQRALPPGARPGHLPLSRAGRGYGENAEQIDRSRAAQRRIVPRFPRDTPVQPGSAPPRADQRRADPPRSSTPLGRRTSGVTVAA